MDFHPLAEVFPLMSALEFERLSCDIEQNGLLEPIWIYQDKIIDGRNRFRACEMIGVEPRYREYEGSPGNLIAFVVSLNLHRRHLSESQRALIAAKLATMRQGERTDLSANAEKLSQTDAAKLLNVSVDSIGRAAKVINQGVPDLVEKVEEGEISVSQAAKIAALPKGKQKRIIRKGRKSAQKILTEMKTESLKKVTREAESESLIFINPKARATKESVSAAMQLLAASFPEFKSYFLDVVEEIESMELSDQTRAAYDVILSAIRLGYNDHAQLQAKTGYKKDFFENAIAAMLDYRMIYAIDQGGKTDVARGARKTLYFETVPDEEEDSKKNLSNDYWKQSQSSGLFAGMRTIKEKTGYVC